MSAIYHIQLPLTLRGRIFLPTSKSISARALILSALSNGCRLSGLSDCDDTRVLLAALDNRPREIDVKAAGTAMRFSTAFFASIPGEHVLTGTDRMKQRPIRILVDALRELGADIDYLAQEGYPPLTVRGRKLHGGEISIPAHVSSQYISALLMIAPNMEQGLVLHLGGEVSSRPYIDMTLEMMRVFGAKAHWEDGNTIAVESGNYREGLSYSVEPDWSAASYWYEMMALSPDEEARIVLPGLREESLQGDSAVQRIFVPLGVRTTFNEEGAVLAKCPKGVMENVDFSGFPDLAQTLVTTCAMMKNSFRFTGLHSLKIKETDRIEALCKELRRVGRKVYGSDDAMWMDAKDGICPQDAEPVIRTYEDHRMAMSLAPCAYMVDNLSVEHPEVVSKSYPSFWSDLRSVGAVVTG